ncbi:NAD-dependent deacetylase hst3 [Coemansia biformis]|uniref:NAD-dependent deacetylase hst3 n=1 Tax=Coemansia biformis TaxID=1286918 RepID=A0A9W7YHU1_9FUNG|nr:NAD-dependent deacetylase hst3 [Coemansia biformis]
MQRLVVSELGSAGGPPEPCAAALREVQRAVQGCQRCIVITGAGISVSSGIPDFRSPDGLFRQLKLKYRGAVSSGRDLFDATLFHDPSMVGLFYSFMGELRNLVSQASCTPTHAFIKQLDEHSKLLRCYTQNSDSLERRIGLETTFQKNHAAHSPVGGSSGQPPSEPGSSAPDSDAATACNSAPPPRRRRRQATLDKTFTRAVQLHGNLDNVICTICHTDYPFTARMADAFCEGTPPPCPRCKEIETIRDIVGKRSVASGVLRPNIVLYNEAHPQAELIGELSEYDLKQRPDLLIVIGTSLKIPGIKRMIKEMSRCVHNSTLRAKRAGAGKAIFINRDEPPRGWEDVFDYYVAGDADEVPLSQLLPLSRRKVGMTRKAAPKQKDRKLTSMMRVVKTASAVAKPKAAPRTVPRRLPQEPIQLPHEQQPNIDVPKSPLVPPPQCS